MAHRISPALFCLSLFGFQITRYGFIRSSFPSFKRSFSFFCYRVLQFTLCNWMVVVTAFMGAKKPCFSVVGRKQGSIRPYVCYAAFYLAVTISPLFRLHPLTNGIKNMGKTEPFPKSLLTNFVPHFWAFLNMF